MVSYGILSLFVKQKAPSHAAILVSSLWVWGELPDALTCLPSAARGTPATAITLTALVSHSFPVK